MTLLIRKQRDQQISGNADLLEKAFSFCMTAHDRFALDENKRTRKKDGRTPYGVHPIWCATMLMHEQTTTQLTHGAKIYGAVALALHDVLEDTTASLPDWVPPQSVSLIKEMTFASGTEERELLWKRSTSARLLKLYDKVSNFLDSDWMSDAKRAIAKEHIQKLIDDVRINFGELNIVRYAEFLIS